jgi:phasin family protein
MAYSKKSVDDYMAAAKSLTTAKSIQEVFELQTAWAKSTMEGYLAQVNRASETVAASLKETLTPLNARVTAAVETFQSAR